MSSYLTVAATAPIIPRALDLRALLAKRSHFLLGPRQTGKTFLVRQALPEARLDEILRGYPDLEREDIQQAIEYAAWLTREDLRIP